MAVWMNVTSAGQNSRALISAIQAKGRKVGSFAVDLMSKPAFSTTKGVAYSLAVIRGDELSPSDLTFDKIIKAGKSRGLTMPPAEVAGLLAQRSQSELGFQSLVVMFEPIRTSDESLCVLNIMKSNSGGEALYTCGTGKDCPFKKEDVFVFLTK